MIARVIKGLSNFYVVQQENGEILDVRARGKIKKDTKILVGDWVEVDEKNGVIDSIIERKSVLKKPPIANVDQVLVMFSAKTPDFHGTLLSKFLVAMEWAEIQHIIIVITKWDLLSEEEKEAFRQMMKKYPYPCYYTTIHEDNRAIDEIKSLFHGHTTVLAGPSGVGKSSLLRVVFPHLDFAVGGLSEKINRGKHTTRHVEILKLSQDSYFADAPGFSLVEILHIHTLYLMECFKELRPYNNRCYYTGCLHDKEPNCAVKEAVTDGLIAQDRYEDYLSILKELKEAEQKW